MAVNFYLTDSIIILSNLALWLLLQEMVAVLVNKCLLQKEQKMLLINWMYISRIATTVKLVLVQCSEQMLFSVLI